MWNNPGVFFRVIMLSFFVLKWNNPDVVFVSLCCPFVYWKWNNPDVFLHVVVLSFCVLEVEQA